MALFGTDGIRGVAGFSPLDAETISDVCAAVCRCSGWGAGGQVLIARDTRESGPWIRDLAAAAFRRAGLAVDDAGVLPTPVAARLALRRGNVGALVISASHNPYTDNGLKFLAADGGKLPDSLEAAVEAQVGPVAPAKAPPPTTFPLNPQTDFSADPDALAETVRFLRQAFPRALEGGLGVAVDCANGAAGPLAKAISQEVGPGLITVHDNPDGRNINRACGAVHPEAVARVVVETGLDLGIALDGDADRLIACDATGRVLDGDALLWIFAVWMADQGMLSGNAVVGTVMTNLGLEAALARRGIRLERTPVGDRHIQARMRQDHFALGGEPSGHLILGPFSLTGDGLLAGLALVSILKQRGTPLPDLLEGYAPFPARVFNIPVRERRPLLDLPPVCALERTVRELSGGAGRTVIRYSGTEPLLRILVEAENLPTILPAIAPALEELEGF